MRHETHRWYEVLLLVDCGDVCPVGLLTDHLEGWQTGHQEGGYAFDDE